MFLLTIVVTFQLHHCGCMINKCYVMLMLCYVNVSVTFACLYKVLVNVGVAQIKENLVPLMENLQAEGDKICLQTDGAGASAG